MTQTQVELWLLVDENGDYVVAKEQEGLAEAYDNDIGAGADMGRRIVCVTLTVPLPAPIKLTGEVPAEPEPSELAVTAA